MPHDDTPDGFAPAPLEELDLVPVTTGGVERDLRLRWCPNGTQIDRAKAALVGRDPATRVVTALALVGKTFGFWDPWVLVEPVDAAWIVVSGAEDAAIMAATRAGQAQLGDRTGTVSWCLIGPDGSWAVFEAFPRSIPPTADAPPEEPTVGSGHR